MDNEAVSRLVGDTPHMSRAQADTMRDLIEAHAITSVLELGFNHGVSTCYLAAAVAERDGTVTTIDLERSHKLVPNIETLLNKAGLAGRVDVVYEKTSYNWAMMRMLDADPIPRFDLVYVDGAHTWATDGFAFFLAERLLRPGGWIVFDDLDWTIASSPSQKTRTSKKAEEGREIAQIRLVYDLLVKPHPHFDEFREVSGWAFAKKREELAAPAPLRQEFVTRDVGLGATARDLFGRASKAARVAIHNRRS